MIKRKFLDIVADEDFGRQMRFIAGPRQVGKTTLAKNILKDKCCEQLYYNWDDKSVRSAYRNDQDFYLRDLAAIKAKQPWICFDEIHKVHNWKNILKAYFDRNEGQLHTLVTGSARLDLFRKSGDSLTGRYFLFHLLPVTLRELLSNDQSQFTMDAREFIAQRLMAGTEQIAAFQQLLKFSGFPEPLSKDREDFHKIWQRDYLDTIIYEDLREISMVRDLENIANLVTLLPDAVGSPLSINKMSKTLELNFATVKNYIQYLELSYLIFTLQPYSKKLKNSVKKERKLYFYDWTRVTNPAFRFENYVAVELQALISSWHDAGIVDAELCYVRTQDGKETDFLIVINAQPWLLIEAKYSSDSIDAHHYRHAQALGVPYVQLVAETRETLRRHEDYYVVSAARFFC